VVTEEGLTWTVLPISAGATVMGETIYYEFYKKLELPQKKRIVPVPVKKTPPKKSAVGAAGMVMLVSLDSTTEKITQTVTVNELDWNFLEDASPEVSGPLALVRKAIQNAPFTGVWSGKEKVREEMLAALDEQAQKNGWTPATPVTVQSRVPHENSGSSDRTTVAMASRVTPRVRALADVAVAQVKDGAVEEAATIARRIEAPDTINVVWRGEDPGVSAGLTAWRLAVNNFLGGTLTQEQLDALQAVHMMPGGWRQLTKAERQQYDAEKAARPDQDVVLIVKDINGNERPSTVRLMHNNVLGVTVGSPEQNAAKWDGGEKVVGPTDTEKIMAAGLLGEDHTPPAKLSDEAALADFRVKVQAVLDAPADSGAQAELAGALVALQDVSPSNLQAEVLNLRLARDRAMTRPAGALAAPYDKANLQALGLLEQVARSRGISTDFMANHTPTGGITEEGLTIETTSDGTQVPMFKNVPVDIKHFAGFNFQITSIGRNKTGAEIIMAKGI